MTEIVHGDGSTAFEIPLEIGVAPITHIWKGLYDRLSSLPIEEMSLTQVARFLGVDVGRGGIGQKDKDELLTRFAAVCPISILCSTF
jgi:hypothetical protein